MASKFSLYDALKEDGYEEVPVTYNRVRVIKTFYTWYHSDITVRVTFNPELTVAKIAFLHAGVQFKYKGN